MLAFQGFPPIPKLCAMAHSNSARGRFQRCMLLLLVCLLTVNVGYKLPFLQHVLAVGVLGSV